MQISEQMRAELIAHAREEAPNECCGIIATRNGRGVQLHRGINAAASPLMYVYEPNELLRVTTEIDDLGLDVGVIYHSHTRSDPYPSETDINLAFWPETDLARWPGALYVIVGVAGEQPDVRAYSLHKGTGEGIVTEVSLDVI